MSCPAVSDIAHCPLYIESHVGNGYGCVKDMAEPCLVAQGKMDFQASIIELAARGVAHPGMIQAIRTVGGLQ